MSKVKKQLVPSDDNNGSRIILHPKPKTPEGFGAYDLGGGQWTLMDNQGRLNISWMYNYAAAKDPSITDKKPNEWLRYKHAKKLRSDYQNALGFDPVNVVNGGYRGKKSQNGNSRSDESQAQQGFQGIHQVANGEITQTYGTYMIDRMAVTYASWVSFEFHQYVMDIYIRNAGNPLSPSGLILPKDELHRENHAIKTRHWAILQDGNFVPAKLTNGLITFSIQNYIDYLRDDFNLDITLSAFLEWLIHEGLFHKDCLANNVEEIDVYQPNFETLLNDLFAVTREYNLEGKTIRNIMILPKGHDCMIQKLIKSFPQVEEN